MESCSYSGLTLETNLIYCRSNRRNGLPYRRVCECNERHNKKKHANYSGFIRLITLILLWILLTNEGIGYHLSYRIDLFLNLIEEYLKLRHTKKLLDFSQRCANKLPSLAVPRLGQTLKLK